MAVTTRCQHCGQRYSVREDLLGKQIKCKACGQAMTIAAEPAAPKASAAKPTSSPTAAKSTARPASAPSAGKPAAATARPKQAAAVKPAAPKTAAAADPLAGPPTANDPLFAPSTNFLDLFDDASLPAAGAAPLGSAVVLKASKPAAVAAKPVAKKKKKKKKGSGGISIQTETTLRMMWGAFLVLLGLGAFGAAVAVIVTGFSFGLVRLLIVVGVMLIGGGLKLIVG